jgi:hypothetical protein
VLHLVEAMLDRVGLGFVAEMPLAGEVRAVTVLLEKLGNSGSFFAKIILVAGNDNDRQGRTDEGVRKNV